MPRSSLAAARSRSRALRPAVTRITAAVGQWIQHARRRLRPGDVVRKGVGDFVTSIDVRAERRLRRELSRLVPDAGFVGEETGGAAIDRDWVWVVDPIDGTSNFAHGLPHHAVSVALLWRGRPLLACLHCFPENATYHAVDGGGAFRGQRRIRIPKGRFDDGAIVGVQWHRGQQRLPLLPRIQASGARVRTFGCTVVQLADVACGRLDANVQEQGRVWDIAAAGLVVTESGGRFTTWKGDAVFPFASLAIGHTPTIAAAPSVHAKLVRRLRGCRPGAVVPAT